MTSVDPAFGTDPASALYTDVGSQLQSTNTLQQIAGQIGGAGALTAGIAQGQVSAAEEAQQLALANSALSNQFATNEAGFQTGQLGLKGQQIGIQQTGVSQEQALQGVEQPIAQSELVGGLAAQGALNTKGSTQQQAQLGAQQQYTNEQLANAQQNLGIMAQANGMSIQEVQNQLGYALAQSGLQGQMSVVDLLNQVGQINAGELSGLENTLSPILFGAGLNAFAGSSVGSQPVVGSTGNVIGPAASAVSSGVNDVAGTLGGFLG